MEGCRPSSQGGWISVPTTFFSHIKELTMITLHRLGHKLELFHLNPDLIVTVEGHPDTVITLATGAKIVVAETPQRVCQTVRAYRVEILAGAMKRRQDQREDAGGTVSPLRPALIDQSELA